MLREPPARGGPPSDGSEGACLDDETVVALIEGRLDGEARAAVDRHMARCRSCLSVVTASAGALDGDGAPPDAAATPPVSDLDSQLLAEELGVPRGTIGWAPPPTFDEFQLVRYLDEGQMGTVYLCRDVSLDRLVAVKFIGAVPNSAQRDYLVEARAAARLSHANIVTLYRTGEIDGRPYFVYEYVPGRSMDRLAHPVPWQRALTLGIGVARGLAAAHRADVVHRDVKPANTIVTESGEVKVLDFGLAKLVDAAAAFAATQPANAAAPAGAVDRTGAVAGTPRYMAPEVWNGKPATPASDVYSVGVMLYELCTGEAPHVGDTIDALRIAVLGGRPLPLARRSPGIDPAFAAVVDSCLAPVPGDRPANGEALVAALERVGARRSALQTLRRRWWVPAALLAVAGVVGWRVTRTPTGSVLVPAAAFAMGSTEEEIDAAYRECMRSSQRTMCRRDVFEREQPVREVRLSPFRIDVTEVPNQRFVEWLNREAAHLHVRFDEGRKESWVLDGETPIANLYPSFPTHGIEHVKGRFEVVSGYAERPVTQVTWLGAERYCEAQGGRLPTEAEWEHVARPERDHRFPWGSELPRCDGVVFGRMPGQECAGRGEEPVPVGRSPQDRSGFGVFDLAGNVAEWVLDRFELRYRPCAGACEDPGRSDMSPGTGSIQRVFRGGDFAQVGVICRSAGRGRWSQDSATQNIGFRCVTPKGRP